MAFDPDFDKVSLLLHMDGAEGGPILINSLTITVGGA